jgi:hypothetical protein
MSFNSTRVVAFSALLLISMAARLAQAQYALIPSSDYVNVYFFDGFTPVYGTDPTSFTTAGTGTPLTSYSWVNGSTTPGAVPSGSYNSGPMSTFNASAQVSYQQASLFVGSNSLSQAGISPVGTSLTLNNFGAGIAELRIDWIASYTYTGPNGVQVPDLLQLTLSGTVNNYTIFAGEENFQVNAGPTANGSIPIGGDFVNPSSYPGGVNTLANFWGYQSPTTSFTSISPSGNGGPLLINNGDTLNVSGFIDILVDPGSIELTIDAVPEPSSIALSLAGGLGLFFGLRRRNRERRTQAES